MNITSKQIGGFLDRLELLVHDQGGQAGSIFTCPNLPLMVARMEADTN